MDRWFGFDPAYMRMGPSRYEEMFNCHSPVYVQLATRDKIKEIDSGGKILLPGSALDKLLRLNIQTPMMFKVTNMRKQRVTHAGVLEFSSIEGVAIFPKWMMEQLGLRDEQAVKIESATLPKATFAKLKPMSLEFLNISNPKALLEVELRKYACLTKGDCIPITYAGLTIEFLVIDLKPENAVCIIECDLNLDFDAPEGYVEQPRPASTANIKPAAPPVSAYGKSTSGTTTPVLPLSGRRLDGRTPDVSVSMSQTPGASISEAAAALADDLPALPPVVCNDDYKPGSLSFVRYDYKRYDVLEKELKEKESTAKSQPIRAFVGGARTLKERS